MIKVFCKVWLTAVAGVAVSAFSFCCVTLAVFASQSVSAFLTTAFAFGVAYGFVALTAYCMEKVR